MPLTKSFIQDYKPTLLREAYVATANVPHSELSWLVEKLKSKVVQARQSLIEDTIFLGSWMRLQGDHLRAFKIHKTLLNRPNLSVSQKIFLNIELGCDLFALKKGDLGLTYFQHVLVEDRKHVHALFMLARTYEYLGDYQKAALMLKRLIRRGQDEKRRLAYVLSEYAYSLIDQKKPSKAKKIAEEAMALDPSCNAAVLVFADAQLLLGQYELATQAIKTFIIKWPAFTFMAIRRLEDLHYRQENYPLLEETLRSILRQTPENIFILYSIGKLLRKKRKTTESLSFFMNALDLTPTDIGSLRELIEHNLNKDDQGIVQKAIRFFEEFKKNPGLFCKTCKSAHKTMTWHCRHCGEWGTLELRYMVAAS